MTESQFSQILDLLSKKDNESNQSYKERCYILKLRDNILPWKDLADIMTDNLPVGFQRSESAYRREAHRLCAQNKLDFGNYSTCVAEDTTETTTTDEQLRALKIERYKISEERTQNNAYIRKLAREETLKEIASNCAEKMSAKKLLDAPDIKLDRLAEHEGILCISDGHYGIEINNYFNVYNPEICRKRVSQLRDKVIELGHKEDIKVLHVVNLSDLIAGRIHLTLRLESREDVISQTIEVSELLAELLTDLSKHFCIEYRDVLDNHSRLEPNKSDSLELETLARVIPWYLEARLKNNYNVSILKNSYADDIISFETLGHTVVGVHGHKDKPSKVIENMTSMTRRRNDLILSAHLHHFMVDEEHECLRISNGSLMGVDSYAQNLRLTNKPSQNLIISSKENVAEVIYKINLD